ncbi:MAG: alpha-hydroxy-acid oxidizing protein [Desulfotomaculaceae bacterium]
MPDYGHEVQREIYQEARLPAAARLPISYEEWKLKAREVLPKGIFDYIAGGAGAEYTTRANREAFYFWRILPRVLVDVAERELSVNLFGYHYPTPVLLAPVDRQELYHAEGELATARAAAATGVPFVLGSFWKGLWPFQKLPQGACPSLRYNNLTKKSVPV